MVEKDKLSLSFVQPFQAVTAARHRRVRHGLWRNPLPNRACPKSEIGVNEDHAPGLPVDQWSASLGQSILLDLMARPTKKVALKLMKAFAAEHEREPSSTKCRTAGDIAGKICKSQEEFDRAMEFLGPRRESLINAWRRSDGLAVQPNEKGYTWIAGHKE
jgi:hypothetical protein